MLTLFVGDPHVQVSNLKESEDLMQFVLDNAINKNVDKVIILGDLLHTHAIVRVEVLNFWNKWLSKLSNNKKFKTIVLVGNHDMVSNQFGAAHGMEIFSDAIGNGNLTIVDSIKRDGIFTYAPYIHDKDLFINKVNSANNDSNYDKAKVLICHATFNGSRYETGMYAPEGIDLDLVDYNTVISGHIHARQRFGKVIYPGTARWLTASDANHEKGLWLADFDENGIIIKEEFIDTSNVCTPIVAVSWNEGEEAPTIPDKSRVSVELIGSSEWVSKQKALLKGKVNIKTKITDKNNKLNRKSSNSLESFILNIFDTKNISKQDILDYAKEIGLVS